jgi:hypothetical protein
MRQEQARFDVLFIQPAVDRYVDRSFHQIDNNFSALEASSMRHWSRCRIRFLGVLYENLANIVPVCGTVGLTTSLSDGFVHLKSESGFGLFEVSF